MNRTVRPMSPIATRPTVRMTLMTPTRVSISSCLVITLLSAPSPASARLTSSANAGSARVISSVACSWMLAPPVLRVWPRCAKASSRRRMAWSGEM